MQEKSEPDAETIKEDRRCAYDICTKKKKNKEKQDESV